MIWLLTNIFICVIWQFHTCIQWVLNTFQAVRYLTAILEAICFLLFCSLHWQSSVSLLLWPSLPPFLPPSFPTFLLPSFLPSFSFSLFLFFFYSKPYFSRLQLAYLTPWFRPIFSWWWRRLPQSMKRACADIGRQLSSSRDRWESPCVHTARKSTSMTLASHWGGGS